MQSVKQKMVQFAEFEKKRIDLGIGQRISMPDPKLSPEQEAELLKRLQSYTAAAEKMVETEREIAVLLKKKTELENERNIEAERTPKQWPVIGICMIYIVYAVGKRWCK